MKKYGKNKGFTLVEGVIALTVITIITAAVTTLCIYSAKTTPKLYAKYQASNIAADVVTCFNLACEDDSTPSETFKDYLEFYTGIKDITLTQNSNDYSCEFTMDNVKAEVTANFTDETLQIDTYLSTSGSSLYSYSL